MDAIYNHEFSTYTNVHRNTNCEIKLFMNNCLGHKLLLVLQLALTLLSFLFYSMSATWLAAFPQVYVIISSEFQANIIPPTLT